MIGGSWKPSNMAYLQLGEEADAIAASPGGQIVIFGAAAALNIGDTVFVSGQGASAYSFLNNTPGYSTGYFPPLVNKSTTLANYTSFAIGVVVGGYDANTVSSGGAGLYDSVLSGPNYLGTPAATAAGQLVMVMTDGICWSNVDGAIATAGTKVTASATTAGRLSSTGAVAGNFIARVLNTTAGAGAALVLVQLA